VPFYLRTGKRMAERSTLVVVQFKPVPHSIFSRRVLVANRLTIREDLGQLGAEAPAFRVDLGLDRSFRGSRHRRRGEGVVDRFEVGPLAPEKDCRHKAQKNQCSSAETAVYVSHEHGCSILDGDGLQKR